MTLHSPQHLPLARDRRRFALAVTCLCLALVVQSVHAADAIQTLNVKDTGYRGIWYMNQPLQNEYRYKYSGGLGTYCAKHRPFAVYCDEVKKLKDPQEPLQRFFERAGRLSETLGPVLYQLPPRWRANLPRFEHFLAALPARCPQGARISHVIEFRDPSWLVEDVFRLMERHGIAHCIHDMHPLQVPLRVTAPPVYVRLHGDLAHGGDYQEAELETWARRIDGWRGRGLDVFVYFNNDVAGYALQNARALKRLLVE